MQENPFYGAMNRDNCEHYGADYVDGYYAYNYREAGHNSIFLGPDGNDWIAAHVFENGDQDAQIKLVLDRLYYDGNTFYVCDQNGTRVNGPTHGRQSVALGSPVQSPVDKALDTWAWCRRNESFQMPEQADILFENGWRESCDVVWNGLVDTAMSGKQVVDGTVLYNGASYSCRITVTVKK